MKRLLPGIHEALTVIVALLLSATALVGMTIDPSTGLVQWVPSTADIGVHSVEIAVDDGQGGIASQAYALTVLEWINTPPVITSSPITLGQPGASYGYHVVATDADGHTLSFALELAPMDMAMDATTGWITWPNPEVGGHPVSLVVEDGFGGIATQSFSLMIQAQGNTPPVVSSTPITEGWAGLPYVYDVQVDDAEGFPLFFELVQAPAGMGINRSSGEIHWLPTLGDTGNHTISVQVQDAHGASALQTFTLVISDPGDISPPELAIHLDPASLNPGDPCTITVAVFDESVISSLILTADGQPVDLDGNHQATITPDQPGAVVLLAAAVDSAGNTAEVTEQLAVEDAADTDPPVVAIESPIRDTWLSAPAQVIGTVQDPHLMEYVVEYQSVSRPYCWQELARSSQEKSSELLTAFDTTLLSNGLYRIRLTATDTNGQTASVDTVYGVEGNLEVGHFTFTVEDLSLPLRGIPIQVHRTYDSTDKCPGDFGYGWNLANAKVEKNRLLGDQWTYHVEQIQILNTSYPRYFPEPDGLHTANVTFPGEKTMQFDVVCYDFQDFDLPEFVTPYFEAREGTHANLSCSSSVPHSFWNLVDGYKLVDDSVETWDPMNFTLVTDEGMIFALHAEDGIQLIQDPEGNSVVFDDTGRFHSSGVSVSFTRDDEGRITRITDPRGNSSHYSYDENGDLVQVTDRAGHITQYVYDDNHDLLEIIDDAGNIPARMEYDGDGRLVAQVDAYGNRISYTHDIQGHQEIIGDRRGNLSVFVYDDRGNVLQHTDQLGNTTTYTYDQDDNELTKTTAVGTPLEATSSKTYDDRGNVLTETDQLGHTMTYTYDPKNNPLSIADEEGHTTSFTYNDDGWPLTITDPMDEVTTSEYLSDGQGNLLTRTTDPLGHVTETIQNRRGHILSEKDALGNETTFTYDANGNELTRTTTRTDEHGQTVTLTWTKTYDANDHVLTETDPLGHTITREYDANGQVIAETDARDHRTEYEYGADGKLIKTLHPDGIEEISTFDADGNPLTATDRAGRMTRYVYDDTNRQTGMIHADGTGTSQTFDDAGRVRTSTDENGHITTYEYDLAGRRTRIIDALGHESSTTYDDNGNQLTFTDANLHNTTFEYDAKNRRTATRFHDNTRILVAYDALDRKITETDQADVVTQFEYDANGSLIKVIDALGGETEFTYDELGNKLTQTDALGRTTTWACDDAGRPIQRTLPLGQFESLTYDENGNLATRTDFNGATTTFQYDALDRLRSKTFHDGSSVTYTYTPSGQRKSVTDARGTTCYFHDLRDRMIQQENPDATWLAYTYDDVGNRTSVETPNQFTQYGFDDLNRLHTVLAPDGLTEYEYDDVGNRSQVTYPNGTAAEYTYDDLNRLILLENKQSDDTLISSFDYTLGPTGNRLAVEENSGRRVDYTYDDLYRLTQEAIADPVRGNETIRYVYDAVGNRLEKTDNSGTINYTYDANDRLLSAGADAYQYDANGNTVESTIDGVITTYVYDPQNRLLHALSPAAVLDYAYDADDIRVAKSIDGVESRYVVDANRDYAQVLEELDVGGAVVVAYTHGDDLISQNRLGLAS